MRPCLTRTLPSVPPLPRAQIPEYCRVPDEEEVQAHAYELIFAFDELVTLGYNDNLPIPQVRSSLRAHARARCAPGPSPSARSFFFAGSGAHVHRDGQPRGAHPRDDCAGTTPHTAPHATGAAACLTLRPPGLVVYRTKRSRPRSRPSCGSSRWTCSGKRRRAGPSSAAALSPGAPRAALAETSPRAALAAAEAASIGSRRGTPCRRPSRPATTRAAPQPAGAFERAGAVAASAYWV